MTSMAPAGLGQRRAFGAAQSTPTSHINAPALPRGLTGKSVAEAPLLLRAARCSAHTSGAQPSPATTVHRRQQLLPRRQPRGTVITRTFADPVMDAPDVEDEDDRPKWDPSKLTAVVVGAGPTGALAAHYLAMRGYRVEVFDKGPRPRAGDAASVPLVLSSRGAIAFEELGLTAQRRVGPTATPLRGVWDLVGRRLTPVDSSSLYRRTYVTDRSGLAADLVEAAEQKYPGRVSFHFESELVRAELKNRVAGVCPTAAAATAAAAAAAAPPPAAGAAEVPVAGERDVEFDILIGADGTDSSVRRILKAKVKDFAVVRPVEEEGGYVGVWGLPARGLAAEPLLGFYTHRPQEYVYEWAAPGKPAVRLYIDVGGQVAGTVSGLVDADLSGGASGLAAGLAAAYPGFPPEWAAAIGEQVAAPGARPRRTASILQCSQFYGPRTVLLGDAAHGVTGALGPAGLTGQGASAAIESVRTLALVLRGAQDDLDKVPEVYSNVRGDAVMAMQMMEFNELKNQADAGLRKLKFESWWYAWSSTITQGFFRLAALVGSLLSALVPGRFLNAAQVVSKLTDRRIGYSEVIRMLQGYAAPVVMAVFGGVFIGIFMSYASRLA
ncbi:hypothetical protein HXX76_010713 [Chlamydomonas incerta]|uniref:FAD-binding domain-containing protein n=1 Tax=Chlamydomonas incerta TaxID=51695 RepID=A0A835VY94_CHLIN|nr:hypothetical protein HXX76_010713 [Chlamydomonas incerta]|eukprot:KAG2429476.1 hypothetical protein HXX76_010713 [Chlamydomonas incerta]